MNRVVRYSWGSFAAVAVLILVAACGNGTEDDDGQASPQPPAEDSPPPAGEGETTEVTVAMVDYDFELSETTFEPGTYTFVAEQEGEEPHALSIEGPGVNESTPEIAAGGGAEELTVTLESGTYELWCPVGDHRQQGMETTIEVS